VVSVPVGGAHAASMLRAARTPISLCDVRDFMVALLINLAVPR
jgi:hypothetical protein